METLWAGEGSWHTVRDVHETLARERDIAYTTVMTVLDRMARKGLVEQERNGRAYQYRPVASREALTAELMRETLAELSRADRRTALVAFVGDATEEERSALREALAALEADAGSPEVPGPGSR